MTNTYHHGSVFFCSVLSCIFIPLKIAKRKRFINAVDVVVHLHDPPRSSIERRTPPRTTHIQLDDVPRTLIQLSVEGEFRQHDGVVTILMFYRCRASPKHRYDITEVDYGGGGHRTRLTDQ